MTRNHPPREYRIVFDGPPGPEGGRFVEVEDDEGRSIDSGDWRQRTDGLWELVIAIDPLSGLDALGDAVPMKKPEGGGSTRG